MTALTGHPVEVAASHWLSTGSSSTASTPVSVWIPVVAAVIAALAAGWSALLQRRTGREATATAKESADAALASAGASHRSAKAAEDAVELNRSTSTDAAARAVAAALATRYQDAASQLGHDKAAVRLAGVYAMSRLADDWLEERQTCIDVLCAYLRLPWQEFGDGQPPGDEMQVRRTIVSVINRHVAEDAKVSWVTNDFDFTGAQLRHLVLEGCTFAGRVTFTGAGFSGACRLADIAFQSDADFTSCVISGRLKMADVRAEGGWQVTFRSTRVDAGAELDITPNTEDPKDARRVVDCQSMVIRGKLVVRRSHSYFQQQSPLDLEGMELDGGCVQIVSTIDLIRRPSGPRYSCKIRARGWKVSSGSEIDIPQKLIDDGTVAWGSLYGQLDIPADVKMTFTVPAVES